MPESLLAFVPAVKPWCDRRWRTKVLEVRDAVADQSQAFDQNHPGQCVLAHARRIGQELYAKNDTRFWVIYYGGLSATRSDAVAFLEWLAEQPDATVVDIQARWPVATLSLCPVMITLVD